MTNGTNFDCLAGLTVNLDTHATRVCAPFDPHALSEGPHTSCLVRIYPAQGIGQLISLGDDRLVIGRDDA
jgi:hypothetical protein